jgi:hypothetical protein
MRRVHRFLRLSALDRCLLIESALLLGAIKVGLWLLPFQTLRHLLMSIAQVTTQRQAADRASVSQVVWAVTVVSRYFPKVRTCLTQALAMQVLLGRRGHPTHLHIGVVRNEGGQLQAHAWVESGERIITGGLKDLSRYTPLLSRDGKGL